MILVIYKIQKIKIAHFHGFQIITLIKLLILREVINLIILNMFKNKHILKIQVRKSHRITKNNKRKIINQVNKS